MSSRQITDSNSIKKFLMAGHAVFTIRSIKTQVRYTYRVNWPKEGSNMRFVSVLSSGDLYQYFGNLTTDGRYWHGKKSHVTPDAPSVKAFEWFLRHLLMNNTKALSQMEFWHEGFCCRCGRPLTTPESIERGTGPHCAKMMEV